VSTEVGTNLIWAESARLRQLAAQKEEYDQYVKDRARVMGLLNSEAEKLGPNADAIIARFWWYRGEDCDNVWWNPGNLQEGDLMNEQIAPAVQALAKALDTNSRVIAKAVDALTKALANPSLQSAGQTEFVADPGQGRPEAEPLDGSE